MGKFQEWEANDVMQERIVFLGHVTNTLPTLPTVISLAYKSKKDCQSKLRQAFFLYLNFNEETQMFESAILNKNEQGRLQLMREHLPPTLHPLEDVLISRMESFFPRGRFLMFWCLVKKANMRTKCTINESHAASDILYMWLNLSLINYIVCVHTSECVCASSLQ